MKALLVDDHSLFRHGLEMLFKMRLQFTDVVHAECGAQALAALRDHGDVDVVALDLNLGDDNGLQVMASIRHEWPTLPVVMISGSTNVHEILTALGEGAAGFVPKSLSPVELADAMAAVVAGRVFVPPLPESAEAALVLAAAQKVEKQRMADLSEVARKVVSEHDLGHRIVSSGSEVESALATLLDELAEERAQLSEMAYSDALTGIANRRCFVDRAETELGFSRRSGQCTGLVYFDLDNFKGLNDQWGHEIGDLALQHVARVLRRCMREIDLAARLGGDEFAVVLHAPGDSSALNEVLKRTHRMLTEAVKLSPEFEWQPGVSMGACLSDGHESLSDALSRADDALYSVKNCGKNSFAIAPGATGAKH